jgi:hypothetical protein
VADAQFQKALSLDPANPQINIDYAEFLWYQVGYLLPASRQPDEVQQCVKALHLAPQDDQSSSICGEFLASVNVDPEATSLAAEAAAPQPWVPFGIGLVAILAIGGGAYFWRRRSG